jgi:hypothetical protein
MIAAIVWKEWREQRTIALAVLAFGVLALVLTAQFAEASTGGRFLEQIGTREMMALGLAFLAGIVCGAMLLADEKEAGTLEFLDSLPCRRRSLWLGKVVFGLILTVVQCSILGGLALLLDCWDKRLPIWVYGLAVILIGLVAYAWGMFGGAMCRSTLGAVFQGAIGAFLVGIALTVPMAFVFGPRAFNRPSALPILSHYGAWLGMGLIASALIFTAVDRRRAPMVATPVSKLGRQPAASRRRRYGIGALIWLTSRQGVYVTIGLIGAGLMVGAGLLAPEAQALLIWPAATLACGVLAGVTTLGEEQTRGAARFWAERRLPLGRMWLMKTGMHFGIAALGAMVMFLPIIVASPNMPFRSRLFAQYEMGLLAELPRILLLGVVYGFVFGHLTGMLFRKTVVAGLVAMVAAATFLGLIGPSVLAGGAAAWQVWGPAVVVLVTARLLLYPWATERMASRGPVLRAVGGTAAAAVLLSAAIGYRIVEIPSAPDRLAESGFDSTIPRVDENEAGRQAAAAVRQYRTAAEEARVLFPGRPGGSRAAGRPNGPVTDDLDPLSRIARVGWTEESHVLNAWLDRVFAGGWVKLLDEIHEKPLGVFDDPRTVDFFSPPDLPRDLREMILAMRARGAQLQQTGRPEEFVRLFRGGLAVTRCARNKTGMRTPEFALDCEETLLAGLAEWLDRLDGRPDLLRDVLAVLDRHERDMPTGGQDAHWADQVILRNTLERVGSWLPKYLEGSQPDDRAKARAEAESNLIAFAWSVPWERVRRERILRVHSQPKERVDPRWTSGLHLMTLWRKNQMERLAPRDLRGLTWRRLARLHVALKLHALERGEPAQQLDYLVPTYMSALPTDPYSNGPFGYRLSQGESLEAPAESAEQRNRRELATELTWLFAQPGDIYSGLFLFAQNAVPPRPTVGPAVNMVGPGAAIPPPPPPRQLQIPRGAGILWSAGADGKDDGGRRIAPPGGSGSGQDWVIIIPPVRGKPG